MRDPWTDIFYYKEMMHQAWQKNDLKFEKRVLEECDKCIVVSQSIKDSFLKKSTGINADNIRIIPNGYDEDDFKEILSVKRDDFTITYTGTMSRVYQIEVFLDALQDLENAIRSSIKVRFVGEMSDEIYRKVLDRGLQETITFKKYVEHDKIPSLLTESAALLLVIPDMEGNKGILTGKLFEYLGAQRPIICIGPKDGDAACIIESCEAGKTFSYFDREGLLEYIIVLWDQWKKGGLEKYGNGMHQKYTRKNLTKSLAELFS